MPPEARPALLADDDPGCRRLIAHVLQRLGFLVRVAEDGLDAGARLSRDPFAIAVLDVEMPGMSGAQAAAAARRRGVLTPVLLVTAGEGERLALAGVDLLRKPFRIEDLRRQVLRLAPP